MGSSSEKEGEQAGNGPSLAVTIQHLALALLTSLLPLATAHLAAWLERRSLRASPSIEPAVAKTPTVEGPKESTSVSPPKLPPLEKLP